MTKDQIKTLLLTSDAAVERGIVVIFQGQTADEQHTSSTSHSNGRGFNYNDAPYGSYLARWVLSGRHLTGRHLSAARRMCNFYAKQLVAAAEAKAAQRNALGETL